jgi:hypothetical protein
MDSYGSRYVQWQVPVKMIINLQFSDKVGGILAS